MQEQYNIIYYDQDQYEWDCIAMAIYYGELEIVKILEEKELKKKLKQLILKQLFYHIETDL